MTEKKIYIPKEVVAVQHDKTFYVTNFLSVAKSENNEHPLSNYSSMSRYEFCIIGQNNEKYVAASTKIPLNDLRQIIRWSKKIYDKDLEEKLFANTKSEQSQSLAYTVALQGNLKGKTAAQVLLEDIDGYQKLINQGKWLKEHLNGKFQAANQRQIDAIKDAINLQKEGKLSADFAATMEISVYNSGPRALIRKEPPAGVDPTFKPVREMQIGWKIGSKSPVTISIQNYFCPIVTAEQGLINPNRALKDKNHQTNFSVVLTAEEWMNVIESIEMDMRRFEMIYASTTFKDAEALSKQQFSK